MNRSVFHSNVDAQVTRLERFINISNEIVRNPVLHDTSSVVHTLLLASILKMVSAGEAVRVLANSCAVEEILAIGHTMLEVVVNAAFLQHASEKEVERYIRFRPETKPHMALGAPTQEIAAPSALRRFRNTIWCNLPRSAKEVVPAWSRMSLRDRAQFADDASNIPVMSLLVARCSTRGQAAVRGTMGSLDYFVSALTNSPEAQPENRLAALTEALFGVNLCLFTFSFYLSSYFNLRLDRVIEEAVNVQSPRLKEAHSSLL